MRHDSNSRRPRGAPAPSLFLTAILAVALSGAATSCSSPATTSLRVVMTWDEISVDQLEISVVPAGAGAPPALVGPTLRPVVAGAPLSSGQDVIVTLKDELAGTSLLCRASALLKGRLQQLADSTPVTVRRGQVVSCTVAFSSGLAQTGLPNGDPCRDRRQCASQFCADGVCCDQACDGTCMACSLPASPGTCRPIAAGSPPRVAAQCLDQGAASCGNDGTCDGRGACRLYPNGSPCGDGTCNGSSIEGGKICDGDGSCVPGPTVTCAPFLCDPALQPARCRTTCATSADCVSGRTCTDGSCGKKPDGAGCTSSSECQNGHCAGGICCDQACDGPCVSCAQPGSPGVCRPVAAGAADPNGVCHNSRDTDPAGCGDSGTCDGKGACAPYAADTICRPATCGGDALALASTCDGAGTCRAGIMLRCDPFGCRDGKCNSACMSGGDCAAGQTCDTAAMSCGLKGIGQSCAAGAECGSGICTDGLCCNEVCDGPCRSCALASAPGICKNVAPGAADPRGMCAATTPSTCGTDGLCDGNGACRRHLPGTICAAGVCSESTRTLASMCDGQGMCVPGYAASCSPYRCNGSSCFVSCSTDAECLPPLTCMGGACGLKPNGGACTQGNECESAHCADTVCCASASCGMCQACNLSGSLGHCAPVPAMAPDPRGACTDRGAAACGTDGRCDGVGGCHRYAAGTVCVAATCTGTALTHAASCDGAGACVPGSQQPCAPYVCGPNAACRTSCTSSSDCLAPAQCVAGSCGLKPQGVPCAAAAECASGFCTDGVCCGESACTSCQACNVPGKPGMCQNVAAGAADPRGLCRTDPPATCGQNGKCDGGGRCQTYVPGTACGQATCSSSTLTPAPTCGSTGTCVPATTTTDCAPYQCASGACGTTCSQDSDCVAPYVCLGSICKKKVLGAACSGGDECDSGNCVDGVCCGSASCSLCKACNVPGFAGSCANVPAGAPDPRGGCTTEAPAICGRDGKCNGSGACRLYDAATVCAPAVCSAKKKSDNPRTCDGTGVCKPRGTVICSPNDCDTTTGLCP